MKKIAIIFMLLIVFSKTILAQGHELLCHDPGCKGLWCYISISLKDLKPGEHTYFIPAPPNYSSGAGWIDSPFTAHVASNLGSTLGLTLFIRTVDIEDLKSGLLPRELPIEFYTGEYSTHTIVRVPIFYHIYIMVS